MVSTKEMDCVRKVNIALNANQNIGKWLYPIGDPISAAEQLATTRPQIANR